MLKWYSGLMPPTRAHGVPQTLDNWEAVPIAASLEDADEAAQIKRAWTPIRVPWHWQLEDAFSAYEGFVLYRCRFAHGRPPADAVVSLRFGGVYYVARVWLNGVYLGDHEGYFSAFEFDVTDVVGTAGENELLVEVFSPVESEENDRKTIGGVWAMWDGMAPHINPGGIFKEVSLVSDGEVRIRSVEAAADHTGRGGAHVDLYCRQETRAKLVGRVRPLGSEAWGVEFEREVQLEEGENRFDMSFQVPDVRAWSTWDRGEQPLYELVLQCAGAERLARFGARTVELRDWKVYLNGERIFLRGINYLPSDAYPARAKNERLRADAALVREAGMNAVRVHAHVADREFYEACDELGLLVLQDFPLQWTHRRSVLGPAVAQAREMARILRGNPCVGIYLAHDEPFFVAPPEKWSPLGLLRTAAEVLSPRWALWQRRVLDPAVMRAISEEDDARPVIDAAGHPLTTNHLYFGWYYGTFRDLERLVKVFPGFSRLPTEYGAQALPDPE
jgi:beta-mannosidase